MTVHDLFVSALERLNPAELALLRRATGRPLSDNVAVYDLFTSIWWPLRKVAPVPKRLCWLVATLYPWHTKAGGAGNLGTALGRIVPSRLEDRKRYRARFNALLATDAAALESRLAGSIRLLANKRVPVDWRQLLDDLCQWNAPGRPRQAAWARSYFLEVT